MAILESGQINAHSSFNSPPVVCVSESTRQATAVMVTTGVTTRGPYEPWGLLLRRQAAIERGFRPILPLTKADQYLLRTADGIGPEITGRFVTYDPAPTSNAKVDWLTEREWRYVAPDGLSLNLDGLVHGVFVESSGWEPPVDRQYAPCCGTLKRYVVGLNDFGELDFIDDGEIDLVRRRREEEDLLFGH